MKALALHAGLVAALFLAQFAAPAYHHTNLARIMIYAVLAIGYNLLYGYVGLMSLGHAMFFAAGAYGAAFAVHWFGLGPEAALLLGVLAALVLSLIAGAVLLRSTGAAFLIVTLMLAQAFHLAALHFKEATLGDQGIVLSKLAPLAGSASLADPAVKYNVALFFFALALLANLWLVRSPVGRVLIAIRENEPRTRMLGYNTALYRYEAIVISGTVAGLSGSLYCLLFSYAGASFASLQFSTLPLLWTLLGGVGTVIGPFLGTAVMFYLVDVSSGFTSSYLIVIGFALVALTLWFPRGIAGSLKRRFGEWLP
jgi:branched-chain amino acid transport system permease protein